MPSTFWVLKKKANKNSQRRLTEFPNNNETAADTETTTTVPSAKRVKYHNKKLDLERTILQTTADTSSRIRHSLLPGFNAGQHPLSSCDDLRNLPAYTLSLQQPLYVASSHCDLVDICHRRTIARVAYTKRLLRTRTLYQTTRNNNRNLRDLEKKNIYPTILFETAERLERNPDPYFHGSFDYYYAGGNLCVLSNQRVVHVDGENLRNLRIGLVSPHKINCLENDTCTLIEDDSEIFEVCPIASLSKDDASCFFVRQRNTITLQASRPNRELTAVTQFKAKSSPFISCAQSTHDPNSFIVSSMMQRVRHYDLGQGAPTLLNMYELQDTEKISWNTVKAWRAHTFLHANERRMCFMDTRCLPADWLSRDCGFPTNGMGCECISAIAPSKFNNHIYVASNHKLHCLDTRCLGRNFEAEGAVCSWTHLMEYPPAFMKVLRKENTELIALASALAGDLRLCELTRERNLQEKSLNYTDKPRKHLYKSYTLPWQPPTLQEAYDSARLAGKCLQPDADLKNRLGCCTAGLSFYSGASTIGNDLLLTANSNGDVFAYTINERESESSETRTNSSSDEIMCEYARRICELRQPDLNYTDVLDMKGMRKVFRCNLLSNPAKPEEEDEHLNETKPEIPKRRMLGRWQKSLQTLHSYKDVLAQDLLSIWDINYEEKTDISLTHLDKKSKIKPDPESIVNSWLNSSLQPQPMAVIPAENINELSMDFGDITTAGLSESFAPNIQSTQIKEDIDEQMGNSTLEFPDDTLTVKPKPKSLKKKSNYKKGF